MFTCTEGRISRGIARVASRASRIATKLSSSMPLRTWMLLARCSAIVVSQRIDHRAGIALRFLHQITHGMGVGVEEGGYDRRRASWRNPVTGVRVDRFAHGLHLVGVCGMGAA